MSKWNNFMSKNSGKIGKIISWIFNIASLILATLSFVNYKYDLGWIIVLSIVVFNSVFLICVSVYETTIFKKGAEIENSILQENEEKIKEYKYTIKKGSDLNDKLMYYYKYIITTLNKFTTKLLSVNNQYIESKSNIDNLKPTFISDKQEHDLKINDIDINKVISNLNVKTDNEHKKALFREYNHFLSNVTNKLKFMLDAYLRNKNCLLETSIAVKQFNIIVKSSDNISDVVVITTFRDSQTYSLGKREIWEKRYTIGNNTDFYYCLSHPCFLKNNITPDDLTYANEHKEFYNYYNCTIVVPIKYEYPDHMHYYGYLTCDILNDDFSNDDLLDEKMAEIMEATASIIGTYFDTMDYQINHIFKENFLNMVYEMKISSQLSGVS